MSNRPTGPASPSTSTSCLPPHFDLSLEPPALAWPCRFKCPPSPYPPQYCAAASDGCTPELITGWRQALAITLGVPLASVTLRCTASPTTSTAAAAVAPAGKASTSLTSLTTLLSASVRYANMAELNSAYDSVVASINAGTFIKAVTNNLPPAGAARGGGVGRARSGLRRCCHRPGLGMGWVGE